MSNQQSINSLKFPRHHNDATPEERYQLESTLVAMGMSPLSMEEVEDQFGLFSQHLPTNGNGFQQAEEDEQNEEAQAEDGDDVGEDASSPGQSHIGIPSESSDLISDSNEPRNDAEVSDDDLVAEWLETESENDDLEGSDQEDATESVEEDERDAESFDSGPSHPAAPPEAPAPAPPSGSGPSPPSPLPHHLTSSSSSDSEPSRPAKRAKRAPAPISQPIPVARPRVAPKPTTARARIPHSNPRRKHRPYCPKSYVNLNRHVDSVHRKLRPNKCGFCHQGFSDRSKRDQHQRGRVCLRRIRGIGGKGEDEEDGEEDEEEQEGESDGEFGGYGGYEYDDDSDDGMGGGGGGNMGGEGEGVRQLVAV